MLASLLNNAGFICAFIVKAPALWSEKVQKFCRLRLQSRQFPSFFLRTDRRKAFNITCTMPGARKWTTQESCYMLHEMLEFAPIAPEEKARCAELHRATVPQTTGGTGKAAVVRLLVPRVAEDGSLPLEAKVVCNGNILFFVLGVFDLLIAFCPMLAPTPQVERQQHLARRCRRQRCVRESNNTVNSNFQKPEEPFWS